jgi:RNA polymerase sigma factor (TIGR02999 family)
MSEVTRILSALKQGDPQAAAQLLPLVYDELRKLAAEKMVQERPGQTLQATALVHEAYLRLVGKEDLPQWQNRGHFFAAAKEAMRRILIENARRKKNRPQLQGIDLDLFPGAEQDRDDLLAVEAALAKLADEDAQAAEVARLRIRGGLSVAEAADALGLSRSHVHNQWTYARAWLHCVLRDADNPPS